MLKQALQVLIQWFLCEQHLGEVLIQCMNSAFGEVLIRCYHTFRTFIAVDLHTRRMI